MEAEQPYRPRHLEVVKKSPFWWTFLYVFDLAIIIPSSVGFDDGESAKKHPKVVMGSFKTADPNFLRRN